MNLPATPDDGFYREILRGIGAPTTANNLAFIYAWRQAEGGKANYNPFNTTHKMPGSTLYGTNKHGVQNYLTPRDGVTATVNTLKNGKYDSILTLLRADADPTDVAKAVIASPWGTKGLLLDVLAMYARGKVVVAPIAVPPGGYPASSAESATTNAPAKTTTSSSGETKNEKVLRLLKYALAGTLTALVGTIILRQRSIAKKRQLQEMEWPSSTRP